MTGRWSALVIVSMLCVVLFAGVMPGTADAYADKRIEFVVGQKSYSVSGSVIGMDAAPFIENGRTYIPVRFLANSLGMFHVTWCEERQLVALWYGPPGRHGTIYLEMHIGSRSLLVYCHQRRDYISMDVSPVVREGRTFLPARWVVESVGGLIHWEPETRTVYIDTVEHKVEDNGNIPAPQGEVSKNLTLTETDIKNARIWYDVDRRWLQLKDGSFDDMTRCPETFLWTGVNVNMHSVVFGDLDFDGKQEAVAIVIFTSGGSGLFYDIIVFRNQEGRPQHLASLGLGDRIGVHDVVIEPGGNILLDLTIHREGDAAALPTKRVIKKVVLVEDQLFATIMPDGEEQQEEPFKDRDIPSKLDRPMVCRSIVPVDLAMFFDKFDEDKNKKIDIREAQSFFYWMEANISYRWDDEFDPDARFGDLIGDGRSGEQYWQTPHETWHERAGDCEDMATLQSAFFTHFGISSYVGLVNVKGSAVDHAVAIVLIGDSLQSAMNFLGGLTYYDLDGGYYLVVDNAYSNIFGDICGGLEREQFKLHYKYALDEITRFFGY